VGLSWQQGPLSAVIRTFMATTAFIVMTSVSHAEVNARSANHLLPACKAAVEGLRYSDETAQGICMGTVDTLKQLGPYLTRPWCPPNEVTTSQAIRVVVAYLEARPRDLHEDFTILSIRALNAAWPCK
jgi:hypothetical protein